MDELTDAFDIVSQELSGLVAAIACSNTNTTSDERTSPGDWAGRHDE